MMFESIFTLYMPWVLLIAVSMIVLISVTLYVQRLNQKLNKARAKLQKARDELEQRVLDRTAELERINEELEQEITDRSRVEKDLRESEEKFRIFFHSSNDGILIHDLGGNIIEANHKALELFGYSRSEILSLRIPDLHPPEMLRSSEEAFEKIQRDGTVSFEISFKKKNGEIFPALVSASVLEIGGRTVIQGIVSDMTEYRKSEEFIKNILESVDEGFIVVDRAYRIIAANRAFAKQVNIPVEEIVGKNCHEISHHFPRPCFEAGHECSVRETFETGEPARALHEHRDKDGNPLHVEIKAYPMKDSAGAVTSVIEIINDVTERRSLEGQLRHAQKMEAVGQLAGGVAHDFNNILTAIIGYGNLLQLKMREEDPLRVHVNQIVASAERAASLTQSLLAFSRKQIINPRPVEIREIMETVGRLLSRLIGEDIEIRIVYPDEGLTIMADSGQIEQVLMNLATNARDAMPEGGVLSIAAEQGILNEEFVEKHGYGIPGSYLIISVSDTGTGIDEKILQKIFEPFFTTKEISKGTGLGLAMAYGIIKQHKGFIEVFSKQGKGSTFRIYLPLVSADKRDAAGSQSYAISLSGNETILLAEDDSAVCRTTSEILEKFGYTVITAGNGEEALAKFMENRDRIHLLLFDVIMPRKNGREVYEEIKKTKPHIKALFLTGYTDERIEKEGVSEEGLNLCFKPVTARDLLAKVREALDG